MKNSNLIIDENKVGHFGEVKKCITKREKCNKPYQKKGYEFIYPANVHHQHLNEITRPEYQKTYMSLSPC